MGLFSTMSDLLRKSLVIIFLLVWHSHGHADLRFLEIKQAQDVYDLDPFIDISVDDKQEIDIHHIQTSPTERFKPAKTANLNFGFLNQTVWLRLALHNQTQDTLELTLSIQYGAIDYLHFFTQHSNNDIQEIITGTRFPYKNRLIPSNYFAFPIKLKPQEKSIFYIAAQTDTPFALPVRLSTLQHFSLVNANKNLFNGLYVGLMCAMIFYNMFVYISVKDKAYFYYVLFTTASLFTSIMLVGFGSQLLPHQISNNLFEFSLGIMPATAIQFCRYFIRTEILAPRYDRFLRYVVIFYVMLSFVFLLDGFHHTRWASHAGNIIAVIFIGIAIVFGFIHNARTVIFITIAWSILSVSGLVSAVHLLGFTDFHPIYYWTFQIGCSIETVLLSLALADRINILKQDKMESEKMASDAKVLAEAKTKFLTTMSHEIRTPMNGILAMSNLLQHAKSPDEQKNYAQIIHQSGQTLLSIINDILDHAKIEAGKMQLEIIAFNLDQVIDECLNIYAAAAKEKNIILLADIQPDVPIYLLGDPVRLRQILLNFLSNAIKFTTQGSITLTVTQSDNTKQSEQARLKISVKDTGCGMTREVMNQLFQAYAQADASTYRQFGGTGLGLTIAKELVELMHGNIGVDSELSQGTEFWVDIPFSVAKASDIDEIALDTTLLQNKSVLLIHENDRLAKNVQTLCHNFNMPFFYANTESEAKKIVAQQQINYVILQHQFPGLTIDDLKSHTGYGHSVYVLMTAVDQSPDDIVHSSNAVLKQPFTPQRLMTVLITTLQSPLVTSTKKVIQEEDIFFSDCKILVAEDNKVNQIVIQTLLQSFGIDVIMASDGIEAIELARGQHASLTAIFMDVEMPHLDGITATIQLRDYEKQHLLEPVPIIGLSAHASQEHQTKCTDVGMNDYLTKPINRQKLIAILKKVAVHSKN